VGILIDSTVLIAAERERESPSEMFQALARRWGDRELAISVMSAAELFHGCWRADTAARRAAREEFVAEVLAVVPVVPVTLEVARIFGALDAEVGSKGRRLPTSDLLIAATALWRGDHVVTGNVRHFRRVPGLVVHTV
jgi:predicted nucleic acid-binding protein